MTRKFSTLRAKMSPQSRARAAARAKALATEMPLHELRRARELSQVKLAEVLHLKQTEISKIERRTDIYIGTLREYTRAMGGDLEIVAKFPDGEVKIANFSEP